MSRVLLVGRGPLPSETQRHTGFAQLRTAHFLAGLRAAGHAVDLLLIEQDEAPGLLERGRHLAHAADVVVSAGPHRPAAVAVAIAGDRPLWLDLPGDPLAELQALARAPGANLTPTRIAAAQGAALAALERADALSVISDRQRHAALGQLLATGRALTASVPISTVPIAFDLPLPRGQPRAIPRRGPVVLALSGAFAPWLDDEGLAAALDEALAAHRRLHVVVTGGGVAGHYEAGWQRFAAWAAASPAAGRIDLRGWVPHGELVDVLSQAHLGVCLDRPGAEATLGSRTRVLLYAWAGLHVAATPTTELVAELCARDLATPLPQGDPSGVARALRAWLATPPPASRAAAAATHLARRFAPDALVAPIAAFAARPTRHPLGVAPAASLAAEVESLRGQLARIHRSPTWRGLSSAHRLVRRLTGADAE